MKFGSLKKSILAVLIASSAYTFADSAQVISVSGKAEIDRNNSWIPLQKDALINEGEVISTGFKSELLIKYKDSVMKLGSLTRITLEKLASTDKKDDVSVYLNTGTIRSTVNHSENRRISYTVRNPIAVASVRGTDFDMDGLANVDCYSGGVIVVPAEAKKQGKNSESGDAETSSRKRRAKKDSAPKEGTTNAFTSGTDINPNLSGGVLITAGQSTDFSNPDSVFPSHAKTHAEKSIAAVDSSTKTASDNEYVSTASSGDAATSPATAAAHQKGKMIINLKFND